MLDLSKIYHFYELTWFDGSVIHLPKPSEAFLRKIAAFDDMDIPEVEKLQEVKNMAWELLKKNDEGRKFTKAELEKCDSWVASMIIKDYLSEAEKRLGE